MSACVRGAALATILAVVGVVAEAGPAGARDVSIRITGPTSPPVGYLSFCRAFPGECTNHGSEAPEPLTASSWFDLNEVNRAVNATVAPATDLDFYKTEEFWTLPGSHGDCEDYVLLKRKWLVERGWSTSALLVTVVFDEVGDGHAVLLARTDRGDFVLDNKTDEIRAWHETAYRFVKRQSVRDPNRWVALGDPRWSTQSTAAPR
jgi:predicted transglutaminase-like cysteine proteinase